MLGETTQNYWPWYDIARDVGIRSPQSWTVVRVHFASTWTTETHWNKCVSHSPPHRKENREYLQRLAFTEATKDPRYLK